MSSDEPWQTLAACIELASALRSEDPCNYVCHLPIHQDGSCNGLQHYAALGRDQIGGESVNLVPSKRPQDVYSNVAVMVMTLKFYVGSLFARTLISVLGEGGERACKRRSGRP